MKFIEWTSDLDTGFHDIDKQHQELVFHINKFYQANEAGDKERMSIVLFDLIASAHSHYRQAASRACVPHQQILPSQRSRR